MRLLDRYIAGAVTTATLVSLLVVVGLDMFFTVIDQVEDVGKGGYTLGVMLQYVLLAAPQSVYELFPMAALLGSLIGMGTLAANSELIAMRAAGVSIWRIVRSVMQGGALMLVLVVLIGELVAPVSDQTRQNLRAAATEPGVSFLGGNGLWVRDGRRIINARNVLDRQSLADITVYTFDDQGRLEEAAHARYAMYQGGQWQLYGVRLSSLGADGVATGKAERQEWSALLTPELLGIVRLKPQNMAATDINQLVGYLDDNGLDSRQYRFAFWGRFMTPLAALVMLFISVPFVFGSLRSVSAGQRIFVGAMIGFIFYILSQVLTQMGQVYDLPPLAIMLIPDLLFVWLGVRALQRM